MEYQEPKKNKSGSKIVQAIYSIGCLFLEHGSLKIAGIIGAWLSITCRQRQFYWVASSGRMDDRL